MTSAHATPNVPVSWGELLDKITILEIKEERIADPAARSNVRRELGLLRDIATLALEDPAATRLLATLRRINERLWDIEDDIRGKEAQADFGPDFIALARAVYKTNDQRAALKRELNGLLNSELVEEKSYAPSAFFTQEGR
ncbi:MAG TPA: DUF6165 family protein [Allosphingosinicella sp.]|jgi:hypothetical protein